MRRRAPTDPVPTILRLPGYAAIATVILSAAAGLAFYPRPGPGEAERMAAELAAEDISNACVAACRARVQARLRPRVWLVRVDRLDPADFVCLTLDLDRFRPLARPGMFEGAAQTPCR